MQTVYTEFHQNLTINVETADYLQSYVKYASTVFLFTLLHKWLQYSTLLFRQETRK